MTPHLSCDGSVQEDHIIQVRYDKRIYPGKIYSQILFKQIALLSILAIMHDLSPYYTVWLVSESSPTRFPFPVWQVELAFIFPAQMPRPGQQHDEPRVYWPEHDYFVFAALAGRTCSFWGNWCPVISGECNSCSEQSSVSCCSTRCWQLAEVRTN